MIGDVQAQGAVQNGDPGCILWASVEVSNRAHLLQFRGTLFFEHTVFWVDQIRYHSISYELANLCIEIIHFC